MNVDIGFWHGVWSALILVIFVSIVIHVWNRGRRDHYEQAGRIPLQDDDGPEGGRDGTDP